MNNQMTAEKMKHLIKTKIPFDKLEKNQGIYQFCKIDNISAGISYEDDYENESNKQGIFIYNLWWKDNEYINISSISNDEQTIAELVKTWNNLLNGTMPY